MASLVRGPVLEFIAAGNTLAEKKGTLLCGECARRVVAMNRLHEVIAIHAHYVRESSYSVISRLKSIADDAAKAARRLPQICRARIVSLSDHRSVVR